MASSAAMGPAQDYDNFEERYEASAKQRAEIRKNNIKKMYDWRDTQQRGSGAQCTTC